ncbi:MAG: DUF1275 domain-containing protein, partial [Aeromicrobium sp.]
MGIQAATARFIAIKDVTADSPRRVAAVVVLLAGALAGAALWKGRLGAGPVLSGVVTGIVTILRTLHACTPDMRLPLPAADVPAR